MGEPPVAVFSLSPRGTSGERGFVFAPSLNVCVRVIHPHFSISTFTARSLNSHIPVSTTQRYSCVHSRIFAAGGFCRKNATSFGRLRGEKKTPKSAAFSGATHIPL